MCLERAYDVAAKYSIVNKSAVADLWASIANASLQFGRYCYCRRRHCATVECCYRCCWETVVVGISALGSAVVVQRLLLLLSSLSPIPLCGRWNKIVVVRVLGTIRGWQGGH